MDDDTKGGVAKVTCPTFKRSNGTDTRVSQNVFIVIIIIIIIIIIIKNEKIKVTLCENAAGYIQNISPKM